MESGKIASQTGHAFLGAYLQCKNEEILTEYHKDFPKSPGTKIVLKCPNLPQLLDVEEKCKNIGIPVFRVVDSGCQNFFGGQPIVTALGIGPASKDQLKHITKKFQLL